MMHCVEQPGNAMCAPTSRAMCAPTSRAMCVGILQGSADVWQLAIRRNLPYVLSYVLHNVNKAKACWYCVSIHRVATAFR